MQYVIGRYYDAKVIAAMDYATDAMANQKIKGYYLRQMSTVVSKWVETLTRKFRGNTALCAGVSTEEELYENIMRQTMGKEATLRLTLTSLLSNFPLYKSVYFNACEHECIQTAIADLHMSTLLSTEQEGLLTPVLKCVVLQLATTTRLYARNEY